MAFSGKVHNSPHAYTKIISNDESTKVRNLSHVMHRQVFGTLLVPISFSEISVIGFKRKRQRRYRRGGTKTKSHRLLSYCESRSKELGKQVLP